MGRGAVGSLRRESELLERDVARAREPSSRSRLCLMVHGPERVSLFWSVMTCFEIASETHTPRMDIFLYQRLVSRLEMILTSEESPQLPHTRTGGGDDCGIAAQGQCVL